MQFGVQIVDTIPPNTQQGYFTYGWDQSLDVVWMVVPTTPAPGQAQIEWEGGVERTDNSNVTYHVRITNLTAAPVAVEGRYAILNA